MPVVGIGASAGGLEAAKLLLQRLPANTGFAFVFLQHLDPSHESNLSEILGRVSAIPVQQAADGVEMEPNNLYVIPPDAELEIANHVLRTNPRGLATPGSRRPIDHFLRSLAQERGNGAIGIILSGAGTDGAAGLEAVKAAGGVTFAQDPKTARFDSMPQSAAASGSVDFILAPELIAAELAKLGHHPYILDDQEIESTDRPPELEDQFAPILQLLRQATNVDFSLYRENMIRRRIMRRLALRNLNSLEEYRTHIENDSREVAALQKDLLIGVTQFFRDSSSFEALKSHVFPRLFQNKPDGAPIRVWVPGCATGEEVYSIAILLHEHFSRTNTACQVQIFASDVSSAAVDRARRGEYFEAIAADIGPERLRQYFLKVNGRYQVSKALREMCVFSRHDLMQDPPFSTLDLISCRNVLIFFGSVRNNILSLFHYALKSSGFLMLGPAETAPGALFSIVEGAPGIYMRNEATQRNLPYMGTMATRNAAGAHKQKSREAASQLTNDSDLRQETERTLISRYSGAGVVVDNNLEVLEIVGRTPPYLRLPVGKASLNLLKLIPDARLFLEVENLVREAARTGEAARKDQVSYLNDETVGEVNVEVLPLGRTRERVLLILFEPTTGSPEVDRHPRSGGKDREITKLMQDLADARQRILTLSEESRASTDVQESASEDVISANEELQSINEELTSAKEELLSTNEELTTLNEELRSNNAALIESRDFALSIVETAPAPILVLDTDLRIVTANPAFYRLFQISPRDTEGRYLYSILDGCWDMRGVRDMLENTLPESKSVQNIEIERDFPGAGRRVLVLSGRWLDGLQRIVVGIDDVTDRKERGDAALQESEDRFRSMADAAPVMIWVSSPDGTRTFFSKGWLAFTGHAMERELASGWTESVHPNDLHRSVTTYSSSFKALRSFQMEYRLRRADGEYRWLLESGLPRFERGGAFVGFIGSCMDVTELKQAQEENFAKQKLESLGMLAGGIAHDFNNLLGAVMSQSEVGLQELADGSSTEEVLKKIRDVAIRGAEIVRQLMVYAGAGSEVLEPVDVSRVVDDMLALLKVSVSKRVVLETDLDEHLPSVRANSGQIAQIAMNLITNASDAIGDRGGVIRVTTSRITVPNTGSKHPTTTECVQLEVSDTGRGMSPEMQVRVFDPFFTTKFAGHGLGLAVVKSIVSGLGGTIRLTSVPGQGSTFQVSLPSARDASEAAVGSISVAQDEVLQDSAATILLVEDEENLRQAASKLLRMAGFTVVEATDGSAALDVLRKYKQQIRVLVLDLTLPGASSREVFEEATRLNPDIKVIVTSGYGEQAAASLPRAHRFVPKPYRAVDLIDLVRDALSN